MVLRPGFVGATPPFSENLCDGSRRYTFLFEPPPCPTRLPMSSGWAAFPGLGESEKQEVFCRSRPDLRAPY